MTQINSRRWEIYLFNEAPFGKYYHENEDGSWSTLILSEGKTDVQNFVTKTAAQDYLQEKASTPRTIEDWFKTLPNGLQEEFLGYMEEETKDVMCSTLSDAISEGFVWEDYPERFDFIAELYDKVFTDDYLTNKNKPFNHE